MEEVIKYLKKLRENIEMINKMKREHAFMIEVIERDGGLFTDAIIKQFKETNSNICDIIIVEKYFSSL